MQKYPNKQKILNIIGVFILLSLGVMQWGIYFLVTILSISFLIFFHELGHFLAAKQLGVCVNTFSIGFGEKIYTKTVGDTNYCISAIPLGGYVSLKGQEDMDPTVKSYDKDSYNTLSPLGRIYILFAGPFFNIFLAFFLYILLGYVGIEKLSPVVGQVLENSAAQSAGILKNDKVIKINNQNIREWDDISKFVNTKPLNLQIQRDDKILNLILTPKINEKKNIWGESIKAPLIGISPSNQTVILYHKGSESISFAFNETYKASKLIFTGLKKLITGVVPMKEMGGIVAMADITSKAASISLSVLIIIIALISVNLGILNLLPIPALDGGHIAFNLYEFIFKRQIPQKVFSTMTYVGLGLLFTLTAFTIINDFLRLAGAYN